MPGKAAVESALFGSVLEHFRAEAQVLHLLSVCPWKNLLNISVPRFYLI